MLGRERFGGRRVPCRISLAIHGANSLYSPSERMSSVQWHLFFPFPMVGKEKLHQKSSEANPPGPQKLTEFLMERKAKSPRCATRLRDKGAWRA